MPYGGRARAACQPVATEAKAEATDGSGSLPTVINRATAGRPAGAVAFLPARQGRCAGARLLPRFRIRNYRAVDDARAASKLPGLATQRLSAKLLAALFLGGILQ